MSYTFSTSISLGSSRSGLALSAQLFDSTAADVGSLVLSGFAEIGQGNYLWTYDGFPDNFRGGVKFCDSANPSVILAATAINPEDIEAIQNISQDVTVINEIVSTAPKEITINVPQISETPNDVRVVSGTSGSSRISIRTGVR